jgi:hypothetical protein
MKKARCVLKKLVSMLVLLSILFPMISGVIQVEAAGASVISIKFEINTESTLSGLIPKYKLSIYGNNFVNPKVKGGELGEVLLPVNTAESNEDLLVIDDAKGINEIIGKLNQINITSGGAAVQPITLDLSSIPSINNVSKSRVYSQESLDIEGMHFEGINTAKDKLSIAATEYSLKDSANISITNSKISVKSVKAPNKIGVSDIVITRNIGPEGKENQYQIISTLKNSITVVNRMSGIEIERVDPNTGPRNKKNIVSIYGTSTGSNFNGGMKIYVNGAAGRNLGTITDGSGKVIGLSVELPASTTAGAADILLTSGDGSSEFLISNGFIYLDIGNTLSIDDNGIKPNFKKETEDKPVTITGRNIGYFDPANYDKLAASSQPYSLVGYSPYGQIPQFSENNTYKVKYTGTYDRATPVTIMRQISVFIDGEAKLNAGSDPDFTKSKDTIVVNPADVNLDPNEPKSVDVRIKTITTVFKEEGDGKTITVYYIRNEEYTVKNGFTYIPDEITPTVTSITPDYGPNSKDLYMTVKGQNFQVLEDGSRPQVVIGGRTITDVKVYDDGNNLVDGKKLALGTKIKFIMKAARDGAEGVVNVVVKNPSKGQFTLTNAFEFRNPARAENKMPQIFTLKEAFADIRGGAISGETLLITGENFDTALVANPRVLITIDGEKAAIKGKVSADGKTITVIPPPGTTVGSAKLQLINEDGSLAEAAFEYRRAITAPKITKIVPVKGAKGTKLIIKGEDFLLPDGSVEPDDPKRKGTVVLLNGKELNAYNYLPSGSVTTVSDSIYYKNGSLDGEMVKVQDGSTIYVDLPDKFYSFDGSKAAPYLKNESIPLGDLTVHVLNPDGTKSKDNVIFTYLSPGTRPQIDSISPDKGSVSGGTIVTIKGSGFRQEDLKVYFASEAAGKIEFINSTELRVQVPFYPYPLPSNVDRLVVPVMVMNYDGAMAVYQNPGFEYRVPGSKPVISSLSPATGSAAGGETIIIYGKDFRRAPETKEPPSVYFNGIKAEVKWIADNEKAEDDTGQTLVAVTPPSKIEGPVDVVIVNHDSGTYTYKSFVYQKSKPKITMVTPDTITKNGGTRVQINGADFKKNNLAPYLTGEQVERDTDAPKPAAEQLDILAIFGDETTGDKKYIDTVAGPFTAELNDISVEYKKASAGVAAITLYKTGDPGKTPIRPRTEIPFDSAHLFIVNGKQDLGDQKLGDEGIFVEVTPNQVIITRRVSPYARWENSGLQITALTPPVGSINGRTLYVKNLDGATASAKINVVNPNSSPVITDVSPRNKVRRADGIHDYTQPNPSQDIEYYTYTPLNGGAFITINGSDFRKNIKVYIGNKLVEVVSRNAAETQLVVKVPPGTPADLDQFYRILVMNEDGATADSSTITKPHYIVYKQNETKPAIESVTPYNTSSKGQNTVTVNGSYFARNPKVFIGGVECTVISSDGSGKILVTVPLGLTPGKKVVQVMNPDYGFAEKNDAINIVSSPEMTYVYNNTKGTLMFPPIFSIDGGQSIKLTGSDFLTGARVILGGTLKLKSALAEGETGITCYNVKDAEMVIVGGTEAANVKVVDGNTLTFTTPKLKVGDATVIVLNKDGGVSNVINGSYQKPTPDSPGGLQVEVVDSDTVKLEWNKVEDAKHYELYGAYSPDGSIVKDYYYIGSVSGYEMSDGWLRYYADGLKASSWYSFKIKSVNAYGPSDFSSATPFVKTKDKKKTTFYVVVGDYEGGIAQNDRVEILSNAMVFIAGEKSLGNDGIGLSVYFNQVNYSGYNPKSVEVALELLRKYPNNKITINEKDFTLKLQSNNLLVQETNGVALTKVPDSKMTVILNNQLKARGDEIKMKVPKGYKAITAPVSINLAMQVEQDKANIDGLSGSADLIYNVGNELKKKYSGGIYIAYYNNATKKLELLSTQSDNNELKAKAGKSGEYMLIGKLAN